MSKNKGLGLVSDLYRGGTGMRDCFCDHDRGNSDCRI